MPHTVLALARIPVGESEVYDIDIPVLADVPLSVPVTGSVEMFSVSPTSFVGTFRLGGALNLECDRCLNEFSWPFEIGFRAHFDSTDAGAEDSWPVTGGQAELDEPIRQEVLLAVPMKKICKEDCAGISEINPKE